MALKKILGLRCLVKRAPAFDETVLTGGRSVWFHEELTEIIIELSSVTLFNKPSAVIAYILGL